MVSSSWQYGGRGSSSQLDGLARQRGDNASGGGRQAEMGSLPEKRRCRIAQDTRGRHRTTRTSYRKRHFAGVVGVEQSRGRGVRGGDARAQNGRLNRSARDHRMYRGRGELDRSSGAIGDRCTARRGDRPAPRSVGGARPTSAWRPVGARCGSGPPFAGPTSGRAVEV